MSPENYLANPLCIGKAKVLLELETQHRRTSGLAVHCMGNRKQKAHDSALWFPGVRR